MNQITALVIASIVGMHDGTLELGQPMKEMNELTVAIRNFTIQTERSKH